MNIFNKRKEIKELKSEVERQKIQIDYLYEEVWKLKNFIIKKDVTEDEIRNLINKVK